MSAAFAAVLFLAAALPAGTPAALSPTKSWFAPSQPLNVEVKPGGPATLVLTDFHGRVMDANKSTDVAGDSTVNLNDLFVALQTPNTYVLYLVKKQPTVEELEDANAPVEVIAACSLFASAV